MSIRKGLEDLRQGNKNDLRQSQIEAFSGANKVLTDLNKYLFTVATLLIPIIFSLTGIKEIREKFTPEDSLLVKISIICLLVSLLAGFLHMLSELNFYISWKEKIEDQLKIWSSTSFWPAPLTKDEVKKDIDKYDILKTKSDDISSGLPKSSTNIFILQQGAYWFIGLLFIIVILFRIISK